MTIEETIDAFVDGEIVGAAALETALASGDGRAYLIDALSLRGLMQDEPPVSMLKPHRHGWSGLSLARAAMIAFALVGIGYAAGLRRNPASPEPLNAAQLTAPEPTRVIELKPGVNWHESKGGD